MKKNYYVIVVIAILVLCSCIGQEKEWTVDDWKEHLVVVNPSGTGGGGIPGFVLTSGTVKDLPVGTHMVFDVKSEGNVKGLEMPADMVLGLTYLGTEEVNEMECVVLDVTMNMEMDMFGEPMSITREGNEWIGEDGTPVKMDLDGQGEVAGIEIPMDLTGVLTDETVYQGHDCWIFTMTQKSEMMGVSSEIEIVMYLDKETQAPVRMILRGEGMEQDTGYIEPILPTESSTWELGPEETMITPLGTYTCQVIYVMQEGKRVGTIWATQDLRVPLKYTYVYETEDSKLEMTIVLVEYSTG